MKFQAGDEIIVIDNGLLNGLKGKIHGITFNSINQCDEYAIVWEGRTWPETYPVEECDPIWTLFSRTFAPSKAIEFIPFAVTIGGPVTVQCNGHHQWVDVGFQFTREVCKHCNVEKQK